MFLSTSTNDLELKILTKDGWEHDIVNSQSGEIRSMSQTSSVPQAPKASVKRRQRLS